MLFQVTLANTPWTLLYQENLISLESLADIRERVLPDKLKLNDDKTAFTIIGTRKQLAKINVDSASRDSTTAPASKVKNLGTWF